MTNQEINEYIAEHLYKLKRGEDFGDIPHSWGSCIEGHYCCYCQKRAIVLTDDMRAEVCFYQPAPNYSEMIGDVLAKLASVPLYPAEVTIFPHCTLVTKREGGSRHSLVRFSVKIESGHGSFKVEAYASSEIYSEAVLQAVVGFHKELPESLKNPLYI